MTSEGERPEGSMKQPWKKWHADLKPANLPIFQDGAPLLYRGGGNDPKPGPASNHGTTSLQKRQVDLSAFKEKPTPKVELLSP